MGKLFRILKRLRNRSAGAVNLQLPNLLNDRQLAQSEIRIAANGALAAGEEQVEFHQLAIKVSLRIHAAKS